ncbi:hypothetical protein JX265_010469 [Neoarthrinium moseri]|uniref:Tat pathway signal sequence n=1 Tax=Neoarthrinium moseri TaxID=1658444 RepID=A0A9P9WEE1_9PEZI|nr:uncharacterized protein JN550_006271 [Neoarthrinium moseri]KAI1859466.1 hypothetical protein JX265_010469 [Neoarthrinium moseri]KAI1868696.1 hypothetical protein JN550_006271 [Neoarthrinium moseri]
MKPISGDSRGHYDPLQDTIHDEEESPMLDINEQLANSQSSLASTKRRALTIAVFTASNILSMIGGGIMGRWATCPSITHYASSTGLESLVFEEAAIQRSTKFFDTKFFGDFEDNIYRQEASPETDDAWGKLINYEQSDYIIPYEEGIRSGLTDRHMRVSEKYGGGFVASTEGGHNLHCLNFLRKALWYNFNYYEPQVLDLRRLPKHHLTHCLEILRLGLMCNYDTKWLGYVWYNKSHPLPFPDMTGGHMCKDFDAIQRRLSAYPNKPGRDEPDGFYTPPPDSEYILEGIP